MVAYGMLLILYLRSSFNIRISFTIVSIFIWHCLHFFPCHHQLLALIGEQFDHGDEICGAVVNVRGRDRISLWTKNASNEAVQVKLQFCSLN